MKTCTKCLEEKPFDAFTKRSGKQSHLYLSWCKACRSESNASRLKERRESDPTYLEKGKEWRKNNPEKVAEYKRREYEKHKGAYRRRAREWARKNHAERRQIARRYRVKRNEWELNGSFTTAEWESLLERSGQKCLACGRMDVPLTQDHVIPLSKGGVNTIDNIQPLCGPCNSSKGTKTIDYRTEEVQ